MSGELLSSRPFTLDDAPTSWSADAWGALLSLGCVVHCLAAPVALILLPLPLAAWLWSSAAHTVVAIGSTWLIGLAIVPGYRLHGRPEIPFLATLGCGLVILGSLRQCATGCDPWQCLMIGSTPASETLIALGTPIGAVILVATHLLNARWRRHRLGRATVR